MRLVAAVAPTMHIAVPLGIKLLLDVLERDVTAVRAFTRNLQAVFFAGAGIDASLWSRLRRFRDACGSFEILSGYGTTEAASTICLSPAPLEQPGELGHPLPGHEVLLAEAEGRLELRVRGPNVAPGYLTAEGLVPLSLDEGGFYRTGDAALVRRRADGQTVLGFDGRLAEDFKLSSGVKVHTGWLRERLIAHCAPLAEDIVVAGENRDSLVALVLPATSCIADPDLIEKLSRALAAWNESNRGSSTSIARFALAAAAPDRSRGEVSDKGQIVRNRFLRNHAAFFEALHAGEGRTPAA
jgi:feruloyl-CoA synthase